MKAVIFAYSRQGCRTARRVKEALAAEDTAAYTVGRFAAEPGFGDFSPIPSPTPPFYREMFASADEMVFIGSCGIAVRQIAPHVRDKRTDPAVLCIDELGRFVIPLLSGHIGGANELALRVARALGATPVITTATDINRRFSVDAWAARHGFVIDDMGLAKEVSAEILERDVPLVCDFPVAGGYPNGVLPSRGGEGRLGIFISWRSAAAAPFERTLRLIPRVLHLGIGCRRGTPDAAIKLAVDEVFERNSLDLRAVKCVASIDLKSDEAGLLKFCADGGWSPVFYSAEQLRELPGEFTPSEFVNGVTGVDNVCERAASVGAETLIVRKTATRGVTVAVAAERLEVRFE